MGDYDIEPSRHFEEAFNLLCGDLLGEGIHRKVFTCKIDETLVVKLETGHGTFSNAAEWRNWQDCSYAPKWNKWLAPCVAISPLGTVLLQKRCAPIRQTDTLPEGMPNFLTDVKAANFGWLNGLLVCHDYPQINTSLSDKLRKVDGWW
jgi:hypothetical protein